MLEIRGLTKRYGPVTALDGASLTARPGRLLGFLGPNGAGKTTTMRCVFGLATPDAGDVHWSGRPIDANARLHFGYMPEQRGLYPRMRVADQLVYFGRHHGLAASEAKRRSAAWLERFGLSDRARSKLEDLSHGNQQRVQLAAALVHDPELLVLDEPFSGLDPLGVATMSDVLRERAAAGVAVVFSSHQLDLVEEVCEDVAIISGGRIVASGGIDELKAASGRRHLDVEIGGGFGWPPADRGLTVVSREGERVRLLVDDRTDLSGLLASAQAAGEVRRFSYGPPRLSELFMDYVAETVPAEAASR
jgi:ABC-2 type transport system ATP-binding protein